MYTPIYVTVCASTYCFCSVQLPLCDVDPGTEQIEYVGNLFLPVNSIYTCYFFTAFRVISVRNFKIL